MSYEEEASERAVMRQLPEEEMNKIQQQVGRISAIQSYTRFEGRHKIIIHPFIFFLIHEPYSYLSILLCIHPSIHSLILLSIRPLSSHSFISHHFIHSIIYQLIHPSIHSLIPLFIYPCRCNSSDLKKPNWTRRWSGGMKAEMTSS